MHNEAAKHANDKRRRKHFRDKIITRPTVNPSCRCCRTMFKPKVNGNATAKMVMEKSATMRDR